MGKRTVLAKLSLEKWAYILINKMIDQVSLVKNQVQEPKILSS